MKVGLLADAGTEAGAAATTGGAGPVQDLELATVFAAMAGGDPLIREVAERTVLAGLTDPAAIRYRQAVARDCLSQPATVRAVYALAVDACRAERTVWGVFPGRPDSVLYRAAQAMEILVAALRDLRGIADSAAGSFAGPGFTRLFAMLRDELPDAYFADVERHLRTVRFRGGVRLSARLGPGNTGTRYILRQPRDRGWLGRLARPGPARNSFVVSPRDQPGLRALEELRGRGLNEIANALAQSVDHVRGFLGALAEELAFYVGCLNLYERVTALGAPLSFPDPAGAGTGKLSARGLYDLALTLHLGRTTVGNDLPADHRRLLVITGANQGGKSTFLRAVGQAQLLMQSGMFVPAAAYRAAVCSGVFTHFKRAEDPTMHSGKLDEELARMREITDRIRPDGLLLCNESFASTNEAEGSEIARQVLRGLLDAGIEVVFVTHLYDLADGLRRASDPDVLFLRAERAEDGGRTYRLLPAAPLPTSFGQDTYRSVFGDDPGPDGARPPAEPARGRRPPTAAGQRSAPP